MRVVFSLALLLLLMGGGGLSFKGAPNKLCIIGEFLQEN